MRPAVSPLINSLFTVARPTTFKSSKSFGGSDIAVSIVNLVVASNVAIFFNCLALLITSLAPTEYDVPVTIPDTKAPASFNLWPPRVATPTTILGVPNNPYAKSALVAEDAVPVTAPVTAPNNLLAVIIPAWPASIPFECMVIAVPTTAVVNIPLLPLTKFEFIVVIFALVIDPNPIVAVSVMLIAVAATPVWSMNTVFKPTKWEVWVTSWIDRDLALTPAETFIPSSEVVTIPATFIVSFDIILLAVTKPATVYPAAENVLIPANLVVPVIVPTPVTWKLFAFILAVFANPVITGAPKVVLMLRGPETVIELTIPTNKFVPSPILV